MVLEFSLQVKSTMKLIVLKKIDLVAHGLGHTDNVEGFFCMMTCTPISGYIC